MLGLVDTEPAMLRFFHHHSAHVARERIDAVIEPYVAFNERFLVSGLSCGFMRCDLDGFALLERIGALAHIHGRILMHTGRLLDALVRRPFFDSAGMLERAMDEWGKEYDPNEDYLTQLGYMVPAAD